MTNDNCETIETYDIGDILDKAEMPHRELVLIDVSGSGEVWCWPASTLGELHNAAEHSRKHYARRLGEESIYQPEYLDHLTLYMQRADGTYRNMGYFRDALRSPGEAPSIEEASYLIAMWEEYANTPDDNLTKDGLELKKLLVDTLDSIRFTGEIE